MGRWMFIWAVLLVPLPILADDDPEPPGAGNKLQGTWKAVRVIGQKGLEELSIKFEKNQMKIIRGQRLRVTHTFTINPRKKPPHIDIAQGKTKKKVEGIYKFENGELIICFGDRTGKRPTDFSGKDEMVVVLKKSK